MCGAWMGAQSASHACPIRGRNQGFTGRPELVYRRLPLMEPTIIIGDSIAAAQTTITSAHPQPLALPSWTQCT